MGGGQHDVRLDELAGAFDDRARVLVGRIGNRQQADPFERRRLGLPVVASAGAVSGITCARRIQPSLPRAAAGVDEDGRSCRADVSDNGERGNGEAQCAHANPPGRRA